MVSPGWRTFYDKAQVRHLFTVGSDHASLLLDTRPPQLQWRRPFCFDSRWADDPDSHEVIRKAWDGEIRGSNMFGVFQPVKNCRYELRKWSKAKDFNVRRKIIDLQQKLKEIGEDQRQGSDGEVRRLEAE